MHSVIVVKRTAQRDMIEIILECNKVCVPRIGLWSRNKSWPRGATNFILAHKSWPRDLAQRVCAPQK